MARYTFRSNSGHVYIEMDFSTSVIFTRAQLDKLQKQFFYPSAENLFNLLKRARPEENSSESLEVLQALSKRCDPFQKTHTAPT